MTFVNQQPKNRGYIFVLLWVFLSVSALSARPVGEYSPAAPLAEDAPSGAASPQADPGATQAAAFPQAQRPPRLSGSLLDNEYYRESLRLTALARETYDYGDYDLAREYAEKAQEYTRLSDEYIALRLKIAETDDAIAAADQRIEWALGVKADRRYPEEFARAAALRDSAAASRDAEDWDAAIAAARRAIDALAFIRDGVPLPAQYQVRSWAVFRDCFWTIAARDWAYGDTRHWRRLYDANRSKLSDPNNPNLILPGIILDIPSIKGEVREGLWDENADYPSFD